MPKMARSRRETATFQWDPVDTWVQPQKQLHDVIKSFLNSYTKEQLIIEDKKDETLEEKEKESE